MKKRKGESSFARFKNYLYLLRCIFFVLQKKQNNFSSSAMSLGEKDLALSFFLLREIRSITIMNNAIENYSVLFSLPAL